MTRDDLIVELMSIVDRCDTSDDQQAVKSVLYSLLGAISGRQEIAPMNHVAIFSQQMIRAALAQKARLDGSRN